METLLCPWEASSFLFFSSNVPPLVHYSHFVSILAALVIGLYVFLSAPRTPVARLFLLLVTFFSAWTLLDLILWATNRPDVVMFTWSLQILFEPLTYGVAFYLYYNFLYEKWPAFKTNLLVAFLFLPIFSLLHSTFNLESLYLSSCEAAEGPIAKYYTHMVHAALILSIAFVAAHRIPTLANRGKRLVALFFGLGLVTFLLAFSSGTIIGSLTDDWVISQYGLFGMPVFAAFIAYCIVRFRAFNVKVITAELLVVALAIAVVSLIALQSITNVRIVAAVTFILVCVVGYLLIKNVRREIEQRILIQKQEQELEVANKQQENLLHFISHEVKGYLTDSQAGFASIVEGDLGAVSESVKTMSQKALANVRKGVTTIMEILDASNMKKGTVSYAKKQFDFRTAVTDTVAQLTPSAAEKKLIVKTTCGDHECMLTGDEEKLRQHVIRNLIDNAIKYTPAGTVEVALDKRGAVLRFSVKDSGIGVTPEDMKNLFTEGGHGKDSMKTNVHSTGYGLFIAKQIVDAHGGKIWAESEGSGKGSTFNVELPSFHA